MSLSSVRRRRKNLVQRSHTKYVNMQAEQAREREALLRPSSSSQPSSKRPRQHTSPTTDHLDLPFYDRANPSKPLGAFEDDANMFDPGYDSFMGDFPPSSSRRRPSIDSDFNMEYPLIVDLGRVEKTFTVDVAPRVSRHIRRQQARSRRWNEDVIPKLIKPFLTFQSNNHRRDPSDAFAALDLDDSLHDVSCNTNTTGLGVICVFRECWLFFLIQLVILINTFNI